MIQKIIEESPNRPVKYTDELAAINALSQNIIDLKESLIVTIEKNLEEKVAVKLSSLESEIVILNKAVNENHISAKESITQLNETTNNSRAKLNEQFKLSSNSGLQQMIFHMAEH